jgi:hypothetical protein
MTDINIGSGWIAREDVRNWLWQHQIPFKFIPPITDSHINSWHIRVEDDWTAIKIKLLGCPLP